MSDRRPIRRLLAVLTASAAGSFVLCAPGVAAADGTVTVKGTAFPVAGANFAYVGCGDVTAAGAAPSAKIRDIPGTSYGERSTGFTQTGVGAGPKAAVDSVGSLDTFSVDTWSTSGAGGFAWVWLFPEGRNTAWLGRADVGSSESFGTQDASGAVFTWERRNRQTFEARGTGPDLRLGRAAQRFGDGPGHVGFAYGCDGQDFSLDGFSVGAGGAVTTFDFEGLDVTTTISRASVDRNNRTTLVGRSTSGGENTGEPLVLERKRPGDSDFEEAPAARVTVDAAGVHRAQVRPTRQTRFRWSREEVPYADGGLSQEAVVQGRTRTGKPTTRPEDRVVRRDGDPRRSEPARPGPTEPAPSTPPEPEPTAPTDPEPTTPEPTTPEPTTPEPTTPEPTTPEPEPTAPEPTTPVPDPEPEPTEPPAPDPTRSDDVTVCEPVLDAAVAAALTPTELEAVVLGEDGTAGTADDCVWDSDDDWLTEQGLRESVTP